MVACSGIWKLFDDLYDSDRILKPPFFIFSHSPFDVGRSMFDVHFFQSIPGKNNLALMGTIPSAPSRR
jgi:hypothetical protein